MRALLDVNVLIALFDRGHIHYRQAHDRLRRDLADGWASCAITQNGFVRILSQSSYPRPLALVEAAAALRIQIERSDHEFWPDDVSISDPDVFDHARVLGPGQITDLYLLALATKHGGRLVTFDRGIPLAAVRGAEARHLVVI